MQEPEKRRVTSCDNCPCFKHGDGFYRCRIQNKVWVEAGTPEWCPLKEKPVLLVFDELHL